MKAVYKRESPSDFYEPRKFHVLKTTGRPKVWSPEELKGLARITYELYGEAFKKDVEKSSILFKHFGKGSYT